MKKMINLILITLAASLFTSCGKNIMNDKFYDSKSDAIDGKYYLGHWKSNIITIDQSGEIDQSIYLQSELAMTGTSKSDFDAQLKSYDCQSVKELESAKKIEAQVFLYFHTSKYYMVANLVYTTEDGKKLRCTGTLGQGDYHSDAKNYLYLEDIDLGLHLTSKNAGSFELEFLR